ncbi:Oidioi.mRNA.OKI2018_I69.chr1.g2965.t1.cds [Oikopleura dioica]|uniref:Oidioi.mRNA.OKI2018_I69.chr1.g2965.t1.cds n=1 Tax=Oikopleura dioica TaxID=34765 RepID=A0ABN7SX13_OIKDI|nr:Oidioi.mRNA.OKI2018_I69.chr1.g2965.t1.cds [Oikopleura dioica]
MAELSERFDWGRLWLLIASTESKLKNWKATHDAYRLASFRLEGSQAIWSQLGQCLTMIDALELAKAQDCIEQMISEVPGNFEEKLLELKDLVQRMQKVAESKKSINQKENNQDYQDPDPPAEKAQMATRQEDPAHDEAEMKARMRALFERTQKQQKTSSLMDELTELKSTLHGEVKSMAETEVLAYQTAAISKLNKIKELLKNNVENE